MTSQTLIVNPDLLTKIKHFKNAIMNRLIFD